MNILEIIKKAPKDHIYYCTILGNTRLVTVKDYHSSFPIITVDAEQNLSFTKEGHYFFNCGECVIFPSKEQRDWKEFEEEIKEEEDSRPNFKPFDKVLVRDSEQEKWKADFFSYFDENDHDYPFSCVDANYVYCIPYEGNEDKVGKV